jgi:NAD(P)-dependent dehydrogenase (short-subunit alcohol dehydrogenase family)
MTGPNRFDVTDKVVIITGATKGLGRAMAFGLAEVGAKVVVASRKQDACEATAAEIKDKTGADVIGLACHVGNWDAVPAFVDRVHDHFGRIDGLVNNAGISPGFADMADATSEFWDKVFSTNTKGPARLAGLVAPRMRDTGGGSIVNVSSGAGFHGAAHNGVYGASKAALNNITETMAQEWAPWGVRVNTLSPGTFLTPLVAAWYRNLEEQGTPFESTNAQRRAGNPEEAVGLVQFLLSDASSYITGANHDISGGR